MIVEISHDISSMDLDDFCILESAINSGWTKQMIQDAFNNGSSRFVKAICDGKIVGYINYSVIIDEAEINGIVVLEKQRRCGVGQMLMRSLQEYLKKDNIRSIFLEVNQSNSAAIALYQNCGFVQISQRKNYYGKQTALVYQKQLL